MYVNKKRELVFLAHPRTGSIATRNALEHRGFKKQGGHHTGTGVSYRGYRHFCTIRNPWDRFVSWWHHDPQHMEFGMEWIERQISLEWFEDGPNGRRMYPFVWTENPTDILRFETLDTSFHLYLRSKQIEPIELVNTVHKSVREPYRTYYNKETQDLVANTFAEEISRFGYTY